MAGVINQIIAGCLVASVGLAAVDSVPVAQDDNKSESSERGQWQRSHRGRGMYGTFSAELSPKRPITDEQREHIIEVVGDLRPLSEQDRNRLREMDREQFQQLARQHAGRIIVLARLRQHRPRLYEYKIQDLLLDQDSRKLAQKFLVAQEQKDENTSQEAMVELRELVMQQVEVRLETRKFEIEMLEERVNLLRITLREDELRKDELIEVRLIEIQQKAENERSGSTGTTPDGRLIRLQRISPPENDN